MQIAGWGTQQLTAAEPAGVRNMYFPQEPDALIKHNGFVIDDRYGNYGSRTTTISLSLGAASSKRLVGGSQAMSVT